MKKLFVMLCVGTLMLGLAGCGGSDNKGNGQSSAETAESTPAPVATSAPADESSVASSGADGHDYTAGWTEEMNAIRTAITDALGENYWPTAALEPDMLESAFGITADMYDDYLAEMPMISAHVDTLVIIKAKEGQADAVEETLTAYREALVNDTMQYPMNLGKIQASRVEKVGNYVCFVQLGGDTTEALEKGDEAVIAQCQETNELVIEIIGQQVQ
ncbi:MAG: DUF4358 domain-containing protein [Acetatifactor sp.]